MEALPMEYAFWDVQLGSIFWECWDWHQRQLSINGLLAGVGPPGQGVGL
jgi:hypothetical protein